MNPQNIMGTARRETAVTSLAIVGFLALLGLGVYAGIYSARFVPTVVEGLGSAAVYVGSAFSPAPTADLSVVTGAATSTEPTTISFGDEATTTPAVAPVASSTPKTSAPVVTTPVFVPTAPHGLADLTVEATAVGYLTTDSTASFVTGTSVPSGSRPAVKFTVKNVGTNWTGTWSFTASIPSSPVFTYTSAAQESLGPGATVDYILGFDRARSGQQQDLTITVNPGNTAPESNATNNSVVFKLNVQ